jgi:hypothetical protein
MSNNRFPCPEENYWFQLLLSHLAAKTHYFQSKLLLQETLELQIFAFTEYVSGQFGGDSD